jgi:hypothetical protein
MQCTTNPASNAENAAEKKCRPIQSHYHVIQQDICTRIVIKQSLQYNDKYGSAKDIPEKKGVFNASSMVSGIRILPSMQLCDRPRVCCVAKRAKSRPKQSTFMYPSHAKSMPMRNIRGKQADHLQQMLSDS